MGWIKDDKGRCKMYEYGKNAQATSPAQGQYEEEGYFTWMMKSLWDKYEACILYKNESNSTLKITKLKVKTCSCNSGDENYWSSSGLSGTPCKGYGADYYCRIRVTSETDTNKVLKAKFADTAQTPKVKVPNAGYNMNRPGTSTTNTAVFGNAPYEGNEGLVAREFTITDCPEIVPGGHAFVHIGIDNDTWPSGATIGNSTVRFLLDSSLSEVTIEPAATGYFWRYDKTNKMWRVAKPYYLYHDGKWQNVEELES